MSTSSTINANANVTTAILSKIATVTTTTQSTTTTTVTITTRSNFCSLVHLCKVQINNNNHNNSVNSIINTTNNNKNNKSKNNNGENKTNNSNSNVINGIASRHSIRGDIDGGSSTCSNDETFIANVGNDKTNNSKITVNNSHNSNNNNRKLFIRNCSTKRNCRTGNTGISKTLKLRPILCLIIHLNIYFYHITASSLTTGNTKDYLNMDRPNFEDVSPRNVSSVADETAILKCRVKNKGNRTVSWMRKRDLHILTTNIYTYTGDQRFSVLHPADSEDWDLKIDYSQTRDSGIYECQVNTEPKINLAVVLEVTAETDIRDKNSETQHYDAKAARAKILGSTEIHVKRDSTIALACSVNIHASSVSWYHGASVVDFDSLRGGISLETEKTDVGTTSRLMLTRASLKDSGNYTCVPIGAIPASVRVHVLTGEQPAAMQTSNGVLSPAHITTVALCLLLLATWHYSIISQTTSIKKLKLVSTNRLEQQQRDPQQQQKQEQKLTRMKQHMQYKVKNFAQRFLQQRNR